MKIALCIIIKDDSELTQLRAAIASVTNYVDGIFITANGKNVKMIAEYCRINHYNYSYLKWTKDYSAQRNFNFSQVPKGFDYIFWMDTDDVLAGGELLRQVAETAKANNKDVVFLTYWYGCEFKGERLPKNITKVLMEQNRERLIRPGTHIWKGRLHETPVPVTGAKNNYTKFQYDPVKQPIVMVHTSKEEDLAEKMARNKEILELQLGDERRAGTADPRTLLYLMKIYAEAGDEKEFHKCIEYGDEYLTKSGWNEERGVCYEQMGIAWGKLGNTKKQVECFHKSIDEWPMQPLFYIRLATAYFNLGNYSFAEHWMKLGANMDIDNGGSNITNMQAMKVMYSELLLKLNWNAHRDTKKALESAKLLYQEVPTKEHAEQVAFIEDFDKLNDACGDVDRLCKYLDAVDERETITPLLDVLPEGITSMPFAQKIRQRFSKPRRWGNDEICYFANFGNKHFEQWDYTSLDKGIGGSETAVLKLAREWADLGYKVTIYGDPFKRGIQYSIVDYTADNGELSGSVTILPWYYFNPRDSFNIFIQWRTPQLAGKIKCKKFLVDMHDIFNQVDFKDRPIDKILVKSIAHKTFAPDLKNVEVIENGI
jgi:tetratricopeptide (TPR) repeat protein